MRHHIDDWQTDRGGEARRRDRSIVRKVAFGVALGIVVAVLVIHAFDRYRDHAAVQETGQTILRWMDVLQKAATSSQAAPPDKRALAEAAARKERAWEKHYKKPAACDGDPSQQQMIECANHYIRARREFDATYAAGK